MSIAPSRADLSSRKTFPVAQSLLSLVTLLVAILFAIPGVTWWMLLLTVLPQLISDQKSLLNSHWLHRVTPQLTGSVILTFGFWVCLRSHNSLIHELGVVLSLVGCGGLLGWFPIPRGEMSLKELPSHSGLISQTLIPVSLAALLLHHSVSSKHWTERELAILAVVSLCSLALTGLRLLGTLPLDQRNRIVTLTILSNANIATVLAGWEQLYPDRNWSSSSNLLTGQALFFALLTIESLAVLVLHFSLSTFRVTSSGEASSLELPRGLHNHPWKTVCLSLGVLNLAGIPPFPGALWRVCLMSSLILPQERSLITHLSEPHHGFISLSIAFAGVTVLVCMGQLQLFRTLVFSSIPSYEQTKQIESHPGTAEESNAVPCA